MVLVRYGYAFIVEVVQHGIHVHFFTKLPDVDKILSAFKNVTQPMAR